MPVCLLRAWRFLECGQVAKEPKSITCWDGYKFQLTKNTFVLELSATLRGEFLGTTLFVNPSGGCLAWGRLGPKSEEPHAERISLVYVLVLFARFDKVRVGNGGQPLTIPPDLKRTLRHAAAWPVEQRPFDPVGVLGWPASQPAFARETLWINQEGGQCWIETDHTPIGLPAKKIASIQPDKRYRQVPTAVAIEWLQANDYASIPAILAQANRPNPKPKKKKPNA